MTTEEIKKFIEQLISNKFYGKIILNFEMGKLTHIKKEETIKELNSN